MAINQSLTVTLNALDKTTAAFDSLNKNLNGLRDAAVKVGAALVGAMAIKDVVASTEQFATSVRRLQGETGLTAEAASRLAFTAKVVGIETDELAVSLARLAKNMFAVHGEQLVKGTDVFAKWGVTIRDANGVMLRTEQVLANISERVRQLGNNQAAAALEQDLFSRSGVRMHEFLLLGADGMRQFAEMSDRFHRTLTDKEVDQLIAFTRESRGLGEAFEGLKVQIGILLLPVLRDVLGTFTGWISKLTDGVVAGGQFAGAVKVLADAFHILAGMLKVAFEWLGNVWTRMKEIFGTAGSTKLAVDLLVIALAAIGGGPVLAAVAAFVLAIGEIGETSRVITDHWEEWRKAAHEGLLDNQGLLGLVIKSAVLLGDKLSDLGTLVHDHFAPGGIIGSAFSRFGEWIHGIWDSIGTKFSELLVDILNVASPKLLEIGGFFSGLGTKAHEAFESIKSAAKTVMDAVGTIIKDVFSTIGSIIGRALDAIGFDIGPFHLHHGTFTVDKIEIPGLAYIGEQVQKLVGGGGGGGGGGAGGGGAPPPPPPGPEFVGRFQGQRITAETRELLTRFGQAISPLQHGGLITRPTFGLLGEAGPEAVIPLGGAGGLGGTVNIYVSGNIARSERELAERIADEVGEVLVRKVFSQRSLAY